MATVSRPLLRLRPDGLTAFRRAVQCKIWTRGVVKSAYTTSSSVDFPAFPLVKANDFILYSFYLGAGSGITITPPTGFSLVPNVGSVAFPAGAASGYIQYTYAKRSNGSETGVISFALSASTDHTGIGVNKVGVDGNTPFDVTPTASSGVSASISAPTQTTSTNNDSELFIGCSWNGFVGNEVASPGFAIEYALAGQDLFVQSGMQSLAAPTGAVAVATTTTPWVGLLFSLKAQVGAYGALNLSPFPSQSLVTPTGHNLDSGGSGLMLGITFVPQRAGMSLTGIRFFADSSNDTPGSGAVWNSSNTLLGQSVESTVLAGSGWNTLLFSTPVALTSGATYKAGIAIDGASQAYTAQASSFTAAVSTADMSIGINGSWFLYPSAGGFPWNPAFTPQAAGGSGTSSAWYGVDLVYTG